MLGYVKLVFIVNFPLNIQNFGITEISVIGKLFELLNFLFPKRSITWTIRKI